MRAPRFTYDAGLPWKKKKHGWSNPYPGIQEDDFGTDISRCPCDVDHRLAEDLLNQGIPLFKEGDTSRPWRIYNVFRGVPYEARGRGGFHAHPMFFEDYLKLPDDVRDELEQRAGGREVLNSWLSTAHRRKN
jgi:hypothetical protein